MSLIYKNNISRNLVTEAGFRIIKQINEFREEEFVLIIISLEINLILLNGLAIPLELLRHDVTEPIQLEVDKIWHLACRILFIINIIQ